MIGKPPKNAVVSKGKASKPSPPKNVKSKKKTAKPKKQELNIRERKFVKGVIEGLTPTEAMRRAGYAENTALYKHGEKLQKVKPKIDELMEEMGISDRRLLETLDRGLDATKNISCNVIINNHLDDANVQDGMKPAHTMTKDFVEVEDHPTRHKFLETGLKLKGYLQKQDLTLSNPDGSPLGSILDRVCNHTKGIPSERD